MDNYFNKKSQSDFLSGLKNYPTKATKYTKKTT